MEKNEKYDEFLKNSELIKVFSQKLSNNDYALIGNKENYLKFYNLKEYLKGSDFKKTRKTI